MRSEPWSQKASENLVKIRDRRPLVHNITNYVVMNTTANALLACGASPIMAHAVEEVEELVAIAGALVLNIGTLTPKWIESMIIAGRKANSLQVPVILDPVGSGATALRTDSSRRIVEEVKLSVIRGNASEIRSLTPEGGTAKGVDSLYKVEEAQDAAIAMAKHWRTVVVVTGPVDLVTDGESVIRVENGHPLMGVVTGMGCTATALIGAFLAVEPDPLTAAACALALFGVAGEKAAENAAGPGSFQVALFDAIYQLDGEELARRAKIFSV